MASVAKMGTPDGQVVHAVDIVGVLSHKGLRGGARRGLQASSSASRWRCHSSSSWHAAAGARGCEVVGLAKVPLQTGTALASCRRHVMAQSAAGPITASVSLLATRSGARSLQGQSLQLLPDSVVRVQCAGQWPPLACSVLPCCWMDSCRTAQDDLDMFFRKT